MIQGHLHLRAIELSILKSSGLPFMSQCLLNIEEWVNVLETPLHIPNKLPQTPTNSSIFSKHLTLFNTD